MTTDNLQRGSAALAAAGALNVCTVFSLVDPDDAPIGVVLAVVGLGVVTLAGAYAAWRGSRTGLLIAIVAALVNAFAFGLPGWFLDAPPWILALVTTAFVLTIVGIVLAGPTLRRTRQPLA
ncbi:hypothetical protein [Cryptosporangium aurantiacum]|uniref:SPW repeat-containing protein n=1 Tax=Cryptosporangium aurantiacum TaxID=134849 RepID=A0A1M7TV07_9ACTN|nr:hypothetical protein [Cryptosporangium aurantiacum]SHN74569.1 hypothetical protein SAMN05443668_107108 [Cryptosporangium aurantiacum]